MSRTVKTITTVTGPAGSVVYLPNNNPLLRAVCVHIDDAKGDTVETDHAILGWCLVNGEPRPVVYGGLPKATEICLVRDEHAKTWVDIDGNVYTTWKDAIAPLWKKFDARREPKHAPITEPSIGAVDSWGVGQEPRPRPISGPRAKTPPHPRDKE